ncbi:MAG: hypothetical protein MJK04_29105, partial [Psychrosphaera sp.]|nr:hypothetical protein [Psychrosphaera sp.]
MSPDQMTDSNTPLLKLTDAQRDIVFDQMHYPGNAIYNIGGRICLSDIDVDKLLKAHRAVSCAHPVFRMRLK